MKLRMTSSVSLAYKAALGTRLAPCSRWADKIESCHILNGTGDRFILVLSVLLAGG